MLQEYKPHQTDKQTQTKVKSQPPSSLETTLTESGGSCLDLCVLPIVDLTKPKLLMIYIRPSNRPKSNPYDNAKDKITYRFKRLESEELNELFLQATTRYNFTEYEREDDCFFYLFNARIKEDIYAAAKTLAQENE